MEAQFRLSLISAVVVFMSMVYHHFADPIVGSEGCCRVLRDGRHICILDSTRDADFPHRHFLPAMRPLIESELADRNDIRCLFTAAGFTPVVHEIVRQAIAPNWRPLFTNLPFASTRF
jgi:SAM-dependent methyltransferase